MKLAYNLTVLLLAAGLFLPTSRAGEQRPIVVVFNVEIQGFKLSRTVKNNLSDYLTGKLAGAGIFQVVPRDQLKKRLMKQKRKSFKQCYDQSCQIELGRELAAEKTLATKVLKLGSMCTVSVTLYDLKKATADSAASVSGKCKVDDIVASMDKAVDELTGVADDVDLPPNAGDKPAPSSDRKTAKRKIRALMARAEKEEARRKAVENKAALEVKRARAKEIQQAYDRTKQSGGSATEQVGAWESFVSDYPDDNPYLETAKREIKSLEPRVRVEEIKVKVAEADRLGMVFIPAGDFWMGCNPKVDSECRDDEKPGRKVYLDEYFIDKTEVTVEQYGRCVQADRCKKPETGKDYNWEKLGRGKHPINGVDWKDARIYCEWYGKRLPAEAEWEKAARGTDGRKYPWGNQKPSCSYAVMNDGGRGCGKNSTWSVCSKERGNSPYGLCDMAGNVLEWVADWYDKDYYSGGPRRNPRGPRGPGREYKKVLRGGPWSHSQVSVRSSLRIMFSPGIHCGYPNGFRCARSAATK